MRKNITVIQNEGLDVLWFPLSGSDFGSGTFYVTKSAKAGLNL